VEAETLRRLFFPEVKERRPPLKGMQSLVSIEKARALIGFEPQHSIGRYLEE
jgi:nucleoside-diphosphate-sugar epimerase